jgi:hypothetical protein
MALFFPSYSCISNNPDLRECVSKIEIVNGSALSVLIRGRDMIHLGYELAASPLYGNFKPNQQPYRTLVLKSGRDISHASAASTHAESLNLIEEAINIYSREKIIRAPGELPDSIDKDFRYVDFALMKETFCQCGLLCSVLQGTMGGDLPDKK